MRAACQFSSRDCTAFAFYSKAAGRQAASRLQLVGLLRNGCMPLAYHYDRHTLKQLTMQEHTRSPAGCHTLLWLCTSLLQSHIQLQGLVGAHCLILCHICSRLVSHEHLSNVIHSAACRSRAQDTRMTAKRRENQTRVEVQLLNKQRNMSVDKQKDHQYDMPHANANGTWSNCTSTRHSNITACPCAPCVRARTPLT